MIFQIPRTSIMAEQINGLKEVLAVQLRRYFSASPRFDTLLFTGAGFLDLAIYEDLSDIDGDWARQSISSLLQQLFPEQKSREELNKIQLTSLLPRQGLTKMRHRFQIKKTSCLLSLSIRRGFRFKSKY